MIHFIRIDILRKVNAMSEARINVIALVSATVLFFLAFAVYTVYEKNCEQERTIKVGFLYDGDESNPYTENFMQAQQAIERKYGNRVQTVVKRNVAYGTEELQLEALITEGCEVIISNSYGYENTVKKMAAEYPEIQFCQATGDNANVEPVYDNYHTVMGEIYEGRYVSGIVAGLKLRELIDDGKITPKQAVIGYVAAYPYPEVISGYTAFILGVRSIVPEATMKVRYTNSWSSYNLEKDIAKKFIDEGCVLVSQHSDTVGPAVACEATEASKIIYHVGYSQDMKKLAPTTHLISCRINWEPCLDGIVSAMLQDKKIESVIKGTVRGNDISGGFSDGWVEMLNVNSQIAADGTDVKIRETINQIKKHKINVFEGDYIGINPNDPDDIYDLHIPYEENKERSAPSFHYILKDVVIVEE